MSQLVPTFYVASFCTGSSTLPAYALFTPPFSLSLSHTHSFTVILILLFIVLPSYSNASMQMNLICLFKQIYD